MKLKYFAENLFNVCPILKSYIPNVTKAIQHFQSYKREIPVRGAIILNKKMTKALMVKGWKSNSTWGFPRGKINKNEPDDLCAIREVYEEIGFDISPYLKKEDFIEITIKQKNFKLYVITGVPGNTSFCPQTRKEISKIEWHPVTTLPAYSTEETIQDSNRYFMVAPFMQGLSEFIAKKRGVPNNLTSSEANTLINLISSNNGTQSSKELLHDSTGDDNAANNLLKLIKNPTSNSVDTNAQSDRNVLLDLLVQKPEGETNGAEASNNVESAREILSILKTSMDRNDTQEALNATVQAQPAQIPMPQPGYPMPWQMGAPIPPPPMGYPMFPPAPPMSNNMPSQYGYPLFPPAPFGTPGYPVPPPSMMNYPPIPVMMGPASEPSTPHMNHASLSPNSPFDIPPSPSQSVSQPSVPNSTLLALLNSRSKGNKSLKNNNKSSPPTKNQAVTNTTNSNSLLSLLNPGGSKTTPPSIGVNSSESASSSLLNLLKPNNPSSLKSTNTELPFDPAIQNPSLNAFPSNSTPLQSTGTNLLNQLRGKPESHNTIESFDTDASMSLLNQIKGGSVSNDRPNRNVNTATRPSDAGLSEENPNFVTQAQASISPSLNGDITSVASQSAEDPSHIYNNSARNLLLSQIKGSIPTQQGLTSNNTAEPGLATDSASLNLLNQLRQPTTSSIESAPTPPSRNEFNSEQLHSARTSTPLSNKDTTSGLLDSFGETDNTTKMKSAENNQDSSSFLMGLLKGDVGPTTSSTTPSPAILQDPAIVNTPSRSEPVTSSSNNTNVQDESSILMGMLKPHSSTVPESSVQSTNQLFKGGITVEDIESGKFRNNSQSPGKGLLQQLEFEEAQAHPQTANNSLLSMINHPPSSGRSFDGSQHATRSNSQTRSIFAQGLNDNNSAFSSPGLGGSSVFKSTTPPIARPNQQTPPLQSVSQLGSQNSGTSLLSLLKQPVSSEIPQLKPNELSEHQQQIPTQIQPSATQEQDSFKSLFEKLHLPVESTADMIDEPSAITAKQSEPPVAINQAKSVPSAIGSSAVGKDTQLKSDLLAFLHNFSNGTLPAK